MNGIACVTLCLRTPSKLLTGKLRSSCKESPTKRSTRKLPASDSHKSITRSEKRPITELNVRLPNRIIIMFRVILQIFEPNRFARRNCWKFVSSRQYGNDRFLSVTIRERFSILSKEYSSRGIRRTWMLRREDTFPSFQERHCNET